MTMNRDDDAKRQVEEWKRRIDEKNRQDEQREREGGRALRVLLAILWPIVVAAVILVLFVTPGLLVHRGGTGPGRTSPGSSSTGQKSVATALSAMNETSPGPGCGSGAPWADQKRDPGVTFACDGARGFVMDFQKQDYNQVTCGTTTLAGTLPQRFEVGVKVGITAPPANGSISGGVTFGGGNGGIGITAQDTSALNPTDPFELDWGGGGEGGKIDLSQGYDGMISARVDGNDVTLFLDGRQLVNYSTPRTASGTAFALKSCMDFGKPGNRGDVFFSNFTYKPL